jgi:hypothetical protein
VVIKLRRGWVYNSKGKAVPKEALDVSEALAPLLKGLTPPPPKRAIVKKHPFVLEGRVKMTPRRYEILSAVFIDGLDWIMDAVWNYHYHHGPVDHIMMPIWDGKRVESTLTTLHKLRLVRWTRGTINVNLTASGLQAMEEYEAYKGVTQP